MFDEPDEPSSGRADRSTPRRPRSYRAWALAFVVVLFVAAMWTTAPSYAMSSPSSPSQTFTTPTATPTYAPTPTPIASQAFDAVSYQINPAHTGAATATLSFPLKQLWNVDLHGNLSYPIIADGKVFITWGHLNPLIYGADLYALDARSGRIAWGPVYLGGAYNWANAAYDAGYLYVLNEAGVLGKFDATTGALRWRVQLPEGSSGYDTPPTAVQGTVYVNGGAPGGGGVYAIDEATGRIRWWQLVNGGPESPPTLSSDGVFVAFACANTYKLDRLTGRIDWSYATSCAGGGGYTTAYHAGLLYTRDDVSGGGFIFRAATGQIAAAYAASAIPAFGAQQWFVLDNGSLCAMGYVSNTPIWCFRGDGTLDSNPLVLGNDVVIGSGAGNLYFLAANQSFPDVVARTQLGVPVPPPDEQGGPYEPWPGLGYGQGLLVVPAGTRLIAFTSGSPLATSSRAAGG